MILRSRSRNIDGLVKDRVDVSDVISIDLLQGIINIKKNKKESNNK